MLAIAQRVPPETLDEVLAYVVDFEDDQESITTLHSTLLTCRSFYSPSLRALYRDPSRSASKLTWTRAGQLLDTLQAKPDLARCVWRLTQFDTCHEVLQSYARGAADCSEKEVAEWAIEFLLACPKVETLCTPVRLGKITDSLTSTLNAFGYLKHLTVRGPSGFNGIDIDIAQSFVSQLHPKQGRLISLRISRFYVIDLFGLIPEPAGEHPSFQVERIEFDGNQHDVAWCTLFLPSNPHLLRSISHRSFIEFNVEGEALDEVRDKTSSSLECFVFRAVGREQEGIVGTLGHYEDIHVHLTVPLPVEIFRSDYPQLSILILEGIHTLHLAFFAHITNFPHLSIISFLDSIWALDEWEDSNEACQDIAKSIECFPSLAILHLGHLPILDSDASINPISDVCEGLDIDFDFQPCLDAMNEWELRQVLARSFTAPIGARMQASEFSNSQYASV